MKGRFRWGVAVALGAVSLSLIVQQGLTQATGGVPTGYNYDTTYTIQELMATLFDPAVIVLWNPSDEFNEDFTFKIAQDDETWDRLRNNAVILAEAANLINVPGRKANDRREPKGEVVMSGPEIEQLIRERPEAWRAFSQAMAQVANEYYQAALERNSAAYEWDPPGLGAKLEALCAACHQQFWSATLP